MRCRIADEISERVLSNPLIEDYRGGRMTRVGVLVFPGSCDDRDAASGRRARRRRAGADLAPRRRPRAAPTPVIVPGGFSFGDHLRLRRAGRAVAGDGRRARARRRGRPRPRRLQRIPGAHRGRAPAGRPSPQRQPALPLPRRRPGRRARLGVAPRAAAGDRLSIPIEASRRRLVSPRPSRSPSSSGAARCCSATTRTPTAPSARSRASRTNAATSPGSCPTPSMRSTSSSGRSTAACSCRGLLDLARTPVAA